MTSELLSGFGGDYSGTWLHLNGTTTDEDGNVLGWNDEPLLEGDMVKEAKGTYTSSYEILSVDPLEGTIELSGLGYQPGCEWFKA